MSTWLPFVVTHGRGYFGDKSPVQDEQENSCLPSETQTDLAGNTPRESLNEQQEGFPAATPTRRGHSNLINDQTWQNWAKQKTSRSYTAPEIPKEPHGFAYQNQQPYGLPSPNGSISEEGETLVPSASEYDSDAEEADVIQVKHLDQDDIIKKMIEALGKKCDNQPGYVYTFYNPKPEPRASNLVKVGQATDPEQRGNQHKTNCKRENWEMKYADSFRGYKCVERLVLIELHNRRSYDVCNCGTRHREYFDVDKADVSGIIESWQIWLRTYEPYTRGGVLKTVWKDRLDLLKNQSSNFFLCKTCKASRTATSDPKAKDCCIRAGWKAWTNPARATYRYQAFLALIKDTRTSHSLTRPARFLLIIIWARLLISAIFHGDLLIPESSNAISVVHAAFLSLGVVFDLVVSAILFLWVLFAPNREIARSEDTEASESTRKESKAGADSVKESCTTPTKSPGTKAADKLPPSTPKKIDTGTSRPSPAPHQDMELRARLRQEPSVTPTKSPNIIRVGRRSRKVSDSATTGNEKPATNVSSNITPPHRSGTTWLIDTSNPPALGKMLERSFDSNQAR